MPANRQPFAGAGPEAIAAAERASVTSATKETASTTALTPLQPSRRHDPRRNDARASGSGIATTPGHLLPRLAARFAAPPGGPGTTGTARTQPGRSDITVARPIHHCESPKGYF